MQSIGGAQIALGGDMSSAISNPAGLGFFNKSVFAITPSLNFMNANTAYTIVRPNEVVDGFGSDESFRNNFNFANIGTVLYFGKGRYTDDKFKGGSLALTLSRSNNYHLNRSYEGANDYNSIIDNILVNSGSQSLAEINELSYAAYDQFLITPQLNAGGTVDFYSANVGGFPIQRETISERGSHYQFNAAYGGNYDDKIYFGGGMGLQLLNYRQARTYQEFDFLQSGSRVDSLSSITINDELKTRGVGVNFNAGAIYRPVSFVTIGVSYTSPTFFTMDEESFLDLDAEWDPGTTATEEIDGETVVYDLGTINAYQSDLFVNKYRLRTPAKVAVGAAVFIGKNGFLTGDLEFVNYSRSKLNSNDFSTSFDNNVINDIYQNVVNMRFGGEYRMKNFTLRAGYAYFPAPLKDSSLRDRENITFGFGYRTFDYFIDFAVVNTRFQKQAVPYFFDAGEATAAGYAESLLGQPTATSDVRNTTVSVTFGLNF